MNHRWENISSTPMMTKEQKCVKCGVRRYWLYADYQCWKYWRPMENEIVGARETFQRPECEPSGRVVSSHKK